MWKYARLHSDLPDDILPEPGDVPPFDISRLGSGKLKARLSAALYRKLLWPVLRGLQIFAPVARIGGLTILTRDRDVRLVLARPDLFPTPFGPEMKALAGGATFLLGLEGAAHERQEKIIQRLIDPKADLALVSALSSDFADALLDAAKGEIDAQSDLITRVAAEVCCRYFGFAPSDAEEFAEWTIASSNFLFADPMGKPVAAELASAAGARLRPLADRALASAASMAVPPDTLAGRLVRMGREDAGGPTHAEARAILIGLAVGFVPTNALAGGKMLNLLRKNRKARKAAIAAARGHDTAGLERILLEAGRLDPALAPGQWRWCPRETTVERPDGSTLTIPAQNVVLVSTMAALRDPRAFRRPGTFQADRDGKPDLLFGHLAHRCLGEYLAMAQITPTIGALLRCKGIARSLAELRMTWLGPYPRHAPLTYSQSPNERVSNGFGQSGLLYALPLPSGTEAASLNRKIEAEFSSASVRDTLDSAGIVHFLSLTAAEIPDNVGARAFAFLEIDMDGDLSGAAAVIAAIEAPLRRILEPTDFAEAEDFVDYVLERRVPVHGKPWGATALNFYGVPGLSVRDIAREDKLSRYVRKAVDAYQAKELGRSSRPALVLGHVRRLIRQDPKLARDADWRALAAEGRHFETLLLKPPGCEPALSRWDAATRPTLWYIVLRSALFRRVAFGFAIIALIAGTLLYLVLDPGNGDRAALWLSLPWLVLQSLLATLAFFALFFGAAVAVLRWKEARDPVDTERPTLTHLRTLAQGEDLPGHVKNHITVVTPLKRGTFRRFTLAFALWGIGQVVTHYFRPGFVLSMGTIQFARWVRLPGTDTMIFQSNYDGSWESYLEDFITRAHIGQTAVWSNCEGFPAARFLMGEGARNGDQFKHYVRRKQIPTAFWYARFPHLTADQIRRNSLIRDGLARAASDSQAREWLALFGSSPRTDSEVESEEVQAIVFNGFGRLPHATYILVRLPDDSKRMAHWLRALTGFPLQRTDDRLKLFAVDAIEIGETLASQSRIAFGENDPVDGAVAIGMSASGIRRLVGDDHPIMGQLPGQFVMGMRERAVRLGDDPTTSLRWDDAMGRSSVDAILCVYSADADDHRARLEFQLALASAHGAEVVDCQDALPLDPAGFPTDHFGFRDGMVQPVIEGSLKSARDRNPDDVVPAGEMIYGYRNAQGYFPPSVTVPVQDDPFDILPDTASAARRYPRFGRAHAPQAVRDFARNGSFMAVRVLEQHPEEFAQSCADIADRTRNRYRHLAGALGSIVDADWVAAKMVGRWQNGSSLLRNPARAGEVSGEDYFLDFGRNDPRGLQCPLGSHVRRANPRDSLQPGDEKEIEIVNRHRLMRRGRAYEREKGKERGLFFMAICGDLERQFEFVQRSWISAPHFHALDDEDDPLLGNGGGSDRSFTVPTAGGSIKLEGLGHYVTLKAGGYFFLPSRSALLYLANCHTNPDGSATAFPMAALDPEKRN